MTLILVVVSLQQLVLAGILVGHMRVLSSLVRQVQDTHAPVRRHVRQPVVDQTESDNLDILSRGGS